jgi:short subunit dehydrogenase-like uncharacterized protein
MGKVLLYGANGYTGELITRLSKGSSLELILAGRSEDKIKPLAEKHNLEYRVFSLTDSERLDGVLNEVDVVLHCAGPFSLTSRQMVEACLRTRKHYLDITGEIAVFETMAHLDQRAKDAGIMVMPGVGMDVVPSDCLAKHLSENLPSATNLTLAFYGLGRLSHGTQSTMMMNAGSGGAVRSNGRITRVPAAFKTMEIDFGEQRKLGVTIPWGDVSTAFYTTGIPNIEVYTIVPADTIRLMKFSRYLGWLIASKPIQKFIQPRIPPGGPSDSEREKGRVYMWGQVSDAEGNSYEARQKGPEGYTLTALTAINIAEKVLKGNFKSGFQTPGGCYGADLILEIEGVTRW